MPTAVLEDRKSSRLDLRMTAAQKSQIEEAAAVGGMSVSQWSLDRLMSCARADLASWRQTALQRDEFDAFLAALDGPADPAFEQLRSRRTMWDE